MKDTKYSLVREMSRTLNFLFHYFTPLQDPTDLILINEIELYSMIQIQNNDKNYNLRY